MRYQKGFLRIAAVLVLGGLVGACNLFSPTNVEQNNNQVIGQPAQPSPSPSPSPSASPSPGASDATSMGLFAYGYETADGAPAPCQAPPDGQRLNAAQEYIVPANCRLAITATPKTNRDANGDGKPDDATNHGNAITWSIEGAGTLSDRPENPLFNKNYHRTAAGLATIKARLVLPDGRVLDAARGFRNQ